jgi:hypothetical protein
MHLRPDTLLTLDALSMTAVERHLPIEPAERLTDMLDLGGRWLVLTDRSGWVFTATGEREDLAPATRRWFERMPGDKHVERASDGRFWVGVSGVGVLVLRSDLTVENTYSLLPPNSQ